MIYIFLLHSATLELFLCWTVIGFFVWKLFDCLNWLIHDLLTFLMILTKQTFLVAVLKLNKTPFVLFAGTSWSLILSRPSHLRVCTGRWGTCAPWTTTNSSPWSGSMRKVRLLFHPFIIFPSVLQDDQPELQDFIVCLFTK